MTYIDYYKTSNKLEITSVLVNEFPYFNFLANNKFKLYKKYYDDTYYLERLNYTIFICEYPEYLLSLTKEKNFVFKISFRDKHTKVYEFQTLKEVEEKFKQLQRIFKCKYLINNEL